MTDFLAVTIGNTSVAVAAVDAEGTLHDVRREPLERLEALLADRLKAADEAGAPVIVCSVNPPALARLREAVEAAGHAPPLVAGQDFPIAIRTDVDEPDRVGVDRLVAALAAYRRTGGACIVVDAGTAVTVDAVDAEGTFLGGAIFPGPGLMARSLAEGAAQLPRLDIRSGLVSESAIGKNTEEAIRYGVTRALAETASGIAAAMMGELGAITLPVYITGGYAPPTDEEGGADGVVVPNLVLEGLVLAWREHVNR